MHSEDDAILQQSSPSMKRPKASGDHALPKGPQSSFLNGLPAPGEPYKPQQSTTQTLKALILSENLAENFQAAISRVASQGIPELDQISTLDQFYFYVDALATWIPETRHWESDGQTVHERTVYLRIVQFYYYFNQAELEDLQSPITPLEGADLTPVSEWLRGFAREWGAFLDTPASAARLNTFKYAPEYAWQDYAKAPEEYETFNAYFARTFRDIAVQRPVARADDDRVIVFPAESTFVGQWAISTAVTDGPMPAPASIVVKHIQWPIRELLADSEFASDFEGGLFCHSFLNTYDYHRQHAPVSGTIVEAKFIPGQVYLEVGLKETGQKLPNGDLAHAVIPKRYLDASDPTGYQFVQCRGLMVIDTPRFGKVAILPMGMAQVSSVVFTAPEPEQTPILLSPDESADLDYGAQVALLNEKISSTLVGRKVTKGDMISFFQFGGSDCVMAFERRANVTITAQPGVHYPIRSQYAVANFNES